MKMDKFNKTTSLRRVRQVQFLPCYQVTILTCLILIVFLFVFTLNHHSFPNTSTGRARSLLSSSSPEFNGGGQWEKLVRQSSTPRKVTGKTVLVTGAAGFVGSHCVLALKKRGDGVLGLDNFNSYYDPSLKRSRQAHLSKHGIFIVDADINDADLLKKLFEITPFTHILHLAAQAGVRYAIENPNSYIHSNIAGFVNLLEVAAKNTNPQPAIVWASSSSVYGLNTETPFSESDRTDRPASLYAATKKAGEEIAHTYNHIYGLSLTGLRFFTVYGPWGRPDMAYFFFTKAILDHGDITVFQAGDGDKEIARDFTYIDDVVHGCVGAIDTAEKSTGVPGGGQKHGPAQLRVYNLGNTSPVPVSRLVSILECLLGRSANKNTVRMPANGDVPYTHANVSLANQDFGYRPTTDLTTGLRKFVKWYVKYYSIQTKLVRY
ncbi:UDP-D-glucuronate 4-epimerase 6 [Zostera marina]|uniref:UDP-glucuronate 4-epimerase n=1 Tax=Zostera marina TaxID=29655 RepID=A0A0K9NWT3_ZOSMR|nr:UDP-D-glucuronate 4-epimerase 6 [Zostera marina]